VEEEEDVSLGGGVSGDDEEGGRPLPGVASVFSTLPTAPAAAPAAGAWSRALILLYYFCKVEIGESN
jgi:hypothetical protein